MENEPSKLYKIASSTFVKRLYLYYNGNNDLEIRDILSKLPSTILEEISENIFDYLIDYCVFPVLSFNWVICELLKQRQLTMFRNNCCIQNRYYIDIIKHCGYLSNDEVKDFLSLFTYSQLLRIKTMFLRTC